MRGEVLRPQFYRATLWVRWGSEHADGDETAAAVFFLSFSSRVRTGGELIFISFFQVQIFFLALFSSKKFTKFFRFSVTSNL